MLALSIRQPYAELILRGVKTVEYRSRPTKMIGRRFYIYAARKWAGVNASSVRRPRAGGDPVLARDVDEVPLDARLRGNDEGMRGNDEGMRGNDALYPTGVIVGSAVISRCQKSEVRDQMLTSDLRPLISSLYEWHLTNIKRYKRPRKVKRHPQPVWFRPW